MMNTIKRMKLHQFREKIVQDVDVKDIMEYLLTFGAISDEDVQEIYSEKARTDQTRHLLDLLPKKGIEAFDHFVNSLQKDYDWLYKEFTEGSCETDSVDENTFYDAFLLGGIPHPPPYNVKRWKKLAEVQKYLTNLKRGNFVVLHGMTGSGKSCLAAAAFDDRNLFMSTFMGSVNWLTLGECDEEELLSHMNQLLKRLKTTLRHNSAHVVDKVLINQEKAKEELKRCFLEKPVREGLLILDDVTSEKHIEAFDVGCKVMVITKDLHFMNKMKGRYDLIKMNEGFTENESLTLLAQSIDVEVNQLPLQAKVIHNLSQGSPMIMALIAGQLEDNKDDIKCSGGRWEYYVNMLSEKNFSKKKKETRRNSFLQQNELLQTISMSINNLLDDKKKYYQYFALFMEDVNIKPEVLQTLWSFETRYEVEDMMAYFTKKSLAVSKWNEQLSSTVYGIHDLLLHYLKEQLTCEGKIDLHRKLLRRYHEKCNGDFSKLPNDNYIYSYIGYHLYHAEEWQLFQDIFMDLNFLQSKLRVTGPADVLGDFRKYRNHIINKNNLLENKLVEIIRFIEVYGLDLYKDQNIDIIQCGLLEKKSSSIYKECYELAKMSSQKLYFELRSDQDLVSQPLTLPIRDEIVSACFTNEIYKILVADAKGKICLWGLDTIKLITIFSGHHFKVNHMELHPDNQRFLSCSDDGTIKLWSLDYYPVNERVELNSIGDNLRVFSPQHLQESWRSLHLNDSPKDESLRTYTKHRNAVISAKFSHSGKQIVSCSHDCFVVWNCESSIPLFVLEISSDNLPTCCTFSWNDSLIFFGDNKSRVNIYNNETNDYVASFCHTGSIIAILCIPSDNNKIIAVSTDEVRIWQWDEPEVSNPIPKAVVSNNKVKYSVSAYSMGNITYNSFGEKINFVYVCAAASSDGVYLVTASSDFIVSVWDLRIEKLIAEHKNYSGFARYLDTYVEDNIPLLLCGSGDKTVKIWRLDQASTVSSVNLLPNFDAAWVMKDEWLPVAATSDSKNRVQILHGDQYFAKSPVESQQIMDCAVSQSGCEIFYGCADGQVKKFDVENNSCEVIMKFDNEVIYLQCLQNSDISLVAAGDISTLKIWTQDNSVLVCYGQTGPVVRSFLIPNAQQLLACNLDAGVKLWDIRSGKLNQVIIGRPSNAKITSADITEQLDVLVLAEADSSFHVAFLAFQSDFPYVSVNSLITKRVDISNRAVIQCCKISPHGVLLALGLHTGAILIWNLKSLCQIKKLELHSSPIRSMLFCSCNYLNSSSQNSVMLVTVGEKIGWWNVTNLISGCKSSSDISNENKPLTSTENLWEIYSQVKRNQQNINIVRNMVKKEENKNVPLLGCLKLAGSHALKISSSPNSLCFLTIDTSGIVYLMKLVH